MASEHGDDTAAADEGRLAAYAAALADATVAALPGWVERSVARLVAAHRGAVTPEVAAAAREAGLRCAEEVGAELRRLLNTDIDEQRGTPLTVLRSAVRFPTEVLVAAGVPEVVRDAFDVRAFPEDRYGLAPASFADIDEALHEPGIVWGAAKAHVFLTRRRAEGRR